MTEKNCSCFLIPTSIHAEPVDSARAEPVEPYLTLRQAQVERKTTPSLNTRIVLRIEVKI